MALEDKIKSAIRILKLADKEAQQYNEPVEIAYSGGKDSDVLLQLTKESGINYRAIYKNTTIDPPGTIQHVKQNNVEVWNPKRPFFKIVEKKGFPSMFRRFCCAELKEYKILNVCATGIRTEESTRRKKQNPTFEKCRIYNKREKVRLYSPIWDWTLTDVKKFVIDRRLTLAPLYYNNGEIDFTKRLGCLGCPMKSDRGKGDFLNNPRILRALFRAAITYTHTHTIRLFANVYDMFFCNVFCKSYAEYIYKKQKDLFNNTLDTKNYLEQYFKTTLP